VNVWVVKTSEMLATDNGNGRLLRSGLVAHLLDGRGHVVTWWMSTFDHANRRSRTQQDATLTFGARGVIRMIHSPGYRESVSLARVRDHAIWGRAFRRAIEAAVPPDIIFCAYPTIEAAAACIRFGRQRQVPVVIDLRDMWPDIFSEFAPAALRPAAQWMLWPWRARARSALRGATALFAITDEFLSWGLRLAGRERREWDGAFLLAFPDGDSEADDNAALQAAGFWDACGVHTGQAFNVVLVGSMTRRRFEMETVLAAARELQHDAAPVKFILAGDGDDLPLYRQQAQDCANLIFPGWLSAPRIRELLHRAHVGLVPYRRTPDLVMSVPNKVGEYLAAGVPVATCLTGTLARLLTERDCGVLFEAAQPASLVQLVRRLRDDQPRRLALQANARRVYREELAAHVVYGRLVERLEVIAGAASPTRAFESTGQRMRIHT
jgi:glycosyltransferase involved in cell wall biosynthesis